MIDITAGLYFGGGGHLLVQILMIYSLPQHQFFSGGCDGKIQVKE